jgi:hypothetical protein
LKKAKKAKKCWAMESSANGIKEEKRPKEIGDGTK